MADNPLNEIAESIKKQNKEAQKQSSKSAAVVEKIGSDVKATAAKSIKGVGDKAKKTIENVPTLAMSNLDPSTQLVFTKIGDAVESSFKYVKSFGSVISDKDSGADEERDETQEKIQQSTEKNTESLSTLDQSVNRGFDSLLAFLQGKSLEDYEREREEAIERKQMLSEMGKRGGASGEVEEDSESSGFTLSPIFARIMPFVKMLAVGGGIALAVGGLYLLFKSIKDNPVFLETVESVKNIWENSILPTFNNIRDAVMGFVESPAFDAIIESLDNIRNAIQNFVSRTLGTLVETFAGVFDGVGDVISGILSFDLGKIYSGLNGITEAIMKGLISGIDNILTGVIELFGFSFADDATLFEAITQGIKNLIGSIKDGIAALFTNVSNMFSAFDQAVEEFFLGIGDSIRDLISDVVKAPFKLFENLRDWISEKVSGLVSKFASFIPGPIKTLLGLNDSDEEGGGEESQGVASQALKDLGGMALDAAGDVGGAISDTVNSIGNAISGFFGGGDDDEDAETAAGNAVAGRRAARDRLREDVATQEGGGSTAAAFDNLQAERDQLEMEGSRRDRRGRGGDVYAPTNVNSSSTTQVIKPLPAVSRRPSSAQDLFYNVAP